MSDDLPDAAKRALAEAEERRKQRAKAGLAPAPKEIGGPKAAEDGAEPTRYGDWEKGGRAIDF